MATTTFCTNFYSEILTLLNDKTLYAQLLTNSATDIMGSSLSNISELASYVISEDAKTITKSISGTDIIADDLLWENATFNVRYAVIYDEYGVIMFFIDFGSLQTISNSNFEIDFSSGLINFS